MININSKYLEKFNLNLCMTTFQKHNLIIGKNGSGKTRLLKAIEDSIKNEPEDTQLVTLYFSEISSSFSTGNLSENTSYTDNEIFPYDLLTGTSDLSFIDFLKIMEKDHAQFLTNMFDTSKLRGTNMSNKMSSILNELNSFMEAFINKKIVFDKENSNIYIEECMEREKVKVHIPDLLEDALSKFSPGELMLFYLIAFLLVLNKHSDSKIVLIMDEPELHLHPQALIKFIKQLKELNCISDLFIASHSLFLVPLFEFEEILLMNNGNVISKNSKFYKTLYNELVGSEYTDIFEFLRSLNSWEYYSFIVECFCLPKPVDKIDTNDKQFVQMNDSISYSNSNKPLQLLDYGAGKFRIWSCLKEKMGGKIDENQIIYTAYEPYPATEDGAGQAIEFPPRFFSNFNDLKHENTKYDYVVLMNVLHEIEPTKWLETFQNIASILKNNGKLILLEVMTLNHGEQPYGNYGYLLLQNSQVELLFNKKNLEYKKVNKTDKSNCWVINKSEIKNVTLKTIENSLIDLKNYSYDLLSELYTKRINLAHNSTNIQAKQIVGRKYAFISQQYINVTLALEHLCSEKSNTTSTSITNTTNKIEIKKIYDKNFL